MNETEQRIAIGKIVWREDVEEILKGNSRVFSPEDVPDYLYSLDAMHGALKTLTDEECEDFDRRLRVLIDGPMYSWIAGAKMFAEVFLKTKGLWKP